MLSKKVCNICRNRLKNYDIDSYDEFFELIWKEGNCCCPYNKKDINEYISPWCGVSAKIDEAPPKECPYILEQILNDNFFISNIIKREVTHE